MAEKPNNFDLYDTGVVSNDKQEKNNTPLSGRDTLLISAYLKQTLENTTDKAANSMINGFGGKELELLQHLNTLKNNLPEDDNMLDDFMQIGQLEAIIKDQLQSLKTDVEGNQPYDRTIRIDNRELNDQLPQSVNIKIFQGYYYHEGVGPDHTRNLTQVRYPSKLNDGLQQGENGIIRLSDGKYSYNINVLYQGDGIQVTYGGFTEYIILSDNQKNRPIDIVLGNLVKRGKKGTFLRFKLRLNWR